MDCRLRLSDRVTNKPAPRKLSITMGIELGDVNGDGGKCTCHICFLAGLYGGKLKTYLAGLKQPAGDPESDVRRCNTCFGAVTNAQPHKSCGSKVSLLANLKAALPLETRQKLALETIRETQEQQGNGAGDSVIHLQSHRGGKSTEITVGRQKPTPSSSVLTSEDVKSLQLKRNLNQTQLRGLLGDYRCLNGRASVEPYIVENFLQSKKELRALFSAEMVNFIAKVRGCIFLIFRWY